MSTSSWRGQCLCTAVQFEAEAPFLWAANCHCSLCRRAHSASYVAWVGFPVQQVRIQRGEDKLSAYSSSADAQRRFCGQCGSQLFFTSTRWPGELHVARAALADDADIASRADVFWDDRAPWLHLGEPLPRRGGKTGVEPID